MPWLRRISCTLVAAVGAAAASRGADPSPTPTPDPTPVENRVDLSALEGTFRGRAKVSLDSGATYKGRSRTRIFLTSATSATVRIEAMVEGGARRVSIGNTLVFTAGGAARGSHLAPGVVAGMRLGGLYSASRRRITFSGKYSVGETTGRLAGVLTVSSEGRLSLSYSIFPGESVTAAYTYQYRGASIR